jgi:hypothetical protein
LNLPCKSLDQEKDKETDVLYKIGALQKALSLAGEGNDVILTGQAPVWLYLKIAHALHGKAKKLIYRSLVTGDVVIFDHSPD